MTRLRDAIHEQIDLLKTTDITDEELEMFKTRTKADLIRSLASNEGLAQPLATYQTRYGDWRELFRYLDRVDKVTKADIRRVANQVFTGTNRTTGEILTAEQPRERGKHASAWSGATCLAAAERRLAERSAIMQTARTRSRALAVLLCAAGGLARRRAGQRVEPDSGAAASRVHAAAADSHSARQRHGHLPAGRP